MSSLLERVIIAHRCRSTHHYIAIEALGRIADDEGGKWHDLFLLHHDEVLKGAKAPDAVFKDFKNHVLHISEGEWGGARDKATEWYATAVEKLKKKKWADAAYALGVLSHYYADPIQPFHTGQTEEEGAMHRAVEWSIAKSRDTIKAQMQKAGYPKIEVGEGVGFVSDMVRTGAERSHPHYQTLIDHYNLDAGVKNPPAGLDQTLIDIVADLVAYATEGFATLISRAIAEAGVAAPKTHLSVPGYLATLDIPLRWITSKLEDAGDRRTVAKMYREFQKTGKVIKTLPADDKAIRKLHAKQVLRIPLKELDAQPLAPLGTKHVARDVSALELEKPEKQKPEKTPKAEKPKREKAAKAEKLSKPKAAKPKREKKPKKSIVPAEELDSVELVATEAVAAEADASPAAPMPATIAPEPIIEDTPEPVYEETEIWTEPDDEPVIAVDAEESAETIELDAEAEVAAIADLTEAEKAELEAQLEAELQAEIEAELAAEEVEEIEEELASAELEAPTETDPGDDSHWRVGALNPDSPIVEAPSIGRKTAERLGEVGIFTVGDLLETDCEVAAELLDVDYITEDTLIDWQDQAELMMTVAGLRTHDAQVLVGAGIRSADELAHASARDIFIAATNFLSTPEGDRIARDDDELEEQEVEHWIDLAQKLSA